MSERPEIIVLGGPNGAGKSTTATVLLPETLRIDQFVNADLIAQGLSPFAPQTSSIAAGRLMIQRIHQLRDQRESFAFETTLSARSYVPFLREAQERGYFVSVIYIWLSSVQLALSRVRSRVEQGGHDVPRDIVERRYQRGLENFFHLYMRVADRWMLCDNSDEMAAAVAIGGRGRSLTVTDHDKYELIRERATRGQDRD